MKTKPTNRRPFYKRTFWKITGLIIVLLIVFRIFLPSIVLRYVNNQLSDMKNYSGHAGDIDISLFRGAYVIKDLVILQIDSGATQKGGKDTIPFFLSPRIDLSIEWPALFKGSLVGEIEVDKPVVNFVKGKHIDEDLDTDTSDFRELIKDLMPLSINRFEITDGQIHYIDQNITPVLDISMTDVHIVAINLKNVEDKAEVLPANLIASGMTHGGEFKLEMDFDALSKIPTFDMNAELKSLNLVEMNDFFQAYANFDVERGTFGLYMEFAAREGKFGGYIKPLLTDVKVLALKNDKGIGNVLWELAIGTGIEILENQPTDQFATKIPINGTFKNPHIHWGTAISYVLRNAFVQALRPGVDNSISIQQLVDEKDKGFLKKVFEKKDDKKPRDKKPTDKKPADKKPTDKKPRDKRDRKPN